MNNSLVVLCNNVTKSQLHDFHTTIFYTTTIFPNVQQLISIDSLLTSH